MNWAALRAAFRGASSDIKMYTCWDQVIAWATNFNVAKQQSVFVRKALTKGS